MPDRTEETNQLCKRIAQSAYQLYEARGYVGGYDVQDWLEAVQQIQAESHVETQKKWKDSLEPPSNSKS
jgi:DUF2934 family protein